MTQLVIAALIIFIAYIVLSIIVGIIITVIVLGIAASVLKGDDKVYVDKKGNEYHRKY